MGSTGYEYDEYTQGLLDTLENLKLYYSYGLGSLTSDDIEKASIAALNNFGAPTDIYFPYLADDKE